MSDIRPGPPRTEQDDYYDGAISPEGDSYWSWADNPSRFDAGRWAARGQELLRRTDSGADCFDMKGQAYET